MFLDLTGREERICPNRKSKSFIENQVWRLISKTNLCEIGS